VTFDEIINTPAALSYMEMTRTGLTYNPWDNSIHAQTADGLEYMVKGSEVAVLDAIQVSVGSGQDLLKQLFVPLDEPTDDEGNPGIL